MTIKKIPYLFVFLLTLLCLNTFAAEFEENWNLKTKNFVLDVNVEGEIKITNPENVDFIEVVLTYFPEEDFRQKRIVEKFTPKKNANKQKNSVVFTFNDINSPEVAYSLYTRLETQNTIMEITEKIDFPLKDIPKDVIQYTAPTPIINSDDDTIIQQAQLLAEDIDDLYILVTEVADWINKNVEYDPNFKNGTEEKITSSWVLDRKVGVCKEETNLFIAMMRALGIPTKFISGTAFSDAPESGEPGWGPHAWAEVYFPSVGWVPFDITYQQYAYLDGSHIKLRSSLDSEEDTVSFKWKETGADIRIEPVVTQTHLINFEGEISNIIVPNISIVEPLMGFESYNMVTGKVKSNKSSYLSVILVLSNVSGMDIITPQTLQITLRPNETKQFYWLIKISDVLEKGYVYKIPLEVVSNYNTKSIVEVDIKEDAEYFDVKYFDNVVNSIDIGSRKSSLDDIQFLCSIITDNELTETREVSIGCFIENTGEKAYNRLEVICEGCDKESSIIDLRPFKNQQIGFNKEVDINEVKMFLELAYNNETKKAFVNIPFKQKPKISIINLNYPKIVEYTEKFEVQFSLEKETSNEIKNIKLVVSLPYEDKILKIDDIKKEKELFLKLNGYNLDTGENVITFNVSYEDNEKNKYDTVKQITIEVKGVGFWERLGIFFKGLWKAITGIFG